MKEGEGGMGGRLMAVKYCTSKCIYNVHIHMHVHSSIQYNIQYNVHVLSL